MLEDRSKIVVIPDATGRFPSLGGESVLVLGGEADWISSFPHFYIMCQTSVVENKSQDVMSDIFPSSFIL
jgi:hypothetical protein